MLLQSLILFVAELLNNFSAERLKQNVFIHSLASKRLGFPGFGYFELSCYGLSRTGLSHLLFFRAGFDGVHLIDSFFQASGFLCPACEIFASPSPGYKNFHACFILELYLFSSHISVCDTL